MFPEYSHTTSLLQACAPKQQLWIGRGSNVSLDSDLVDPSATAALSATGSPLAANRDPLPTEHAVAGLCLSVRNHWGDS